MLNAFVIYLNQQQLLMTKIIFIQINNNYFKLTLIRYI